MMVPTTREISRLERRFLLPFLGGILLLAGSLVGQTPGPGADEEKPKKVAKASGKAKPAAAPAVEWLTLELGLAKMRPKHLPGLVLFEPAAPLTPPPAAEDAPPGFFDEHLADSTTRQLLKRFVLIRVTADDLKKAYPGLPLPKDAPGGANGKEKDPAGKKADEGKKPDDGKKGGARGVEDPQAPPEEPPGEPGKDAADPAKPADGAPLQVEATVGARLGLGGTKPGIVVLSYWEEPVLTHVSELPTRSKLREELGRIAKVNEVYALEARRIEPLLEKSRYAFKLKNARDAVLAVRDLEGEKAQVRLDPYLKKGLNETISEYRAKAREEIRKADDLDKQKKYFEAIDAFDKLATDYPFQDIQKQAAIRKGEILRKQAIGR